MPSSGRPEKPRQLDWGLAAVLLLEAWQRLLRLHLLPGFGAGPLPFLLQRRSSSQQSPPLQK